MTNNISTPINAIYIGDCKILIEFENKEIRIADLSYLRKKNLPDFPEMKDEEYIQKFELDMLGGLCWPNEYDIAPDFLYDISKPAIISAVS